MMRHHLRRAALAFLLVTAIAPGASAQLVGQRNGELAEIVAAKGDEELQPAGAADWRQAMVSQDLIAGDLLQTGPFGGLGVAFTDRTQMRLHASSRLQIRDIEASGDRTFDLQAGRLWSRASRPDRGVIVTTPTATAAIRGTDWFIEILEDGSSRMAVMDGSVRFFNELGEVQVDAGASAIARPGAAPVLELIATSQDRPRWALSPRADWAVVLPIEAAAASVQDTSVAVALRALGAGNVARAVEAAPAQSSSDPLALANLRSLIALADRQPAQAREALLAANPASQPPAQVRLQLLTLAGLDIEQRDFGAALANIIAYETTFAADAASAGLRGYLELYAGRYERARELIEGAPQGEPALASAILLAQTSALQGDDAAFGMATQRATTLAPESALAWYWRGIYEVSAGGAGAAEARAPFERAVELNPQATNAWAALGQIRSVSGETDEALSAFDRALAVDPQEPFAIAGKAYVYLHMDRIDLARATLLGLREADATHPEIRSVLAVMALMEDRPEDAAEETGKVIAANPDRPGAALLDGIAHWHAGRHDVARKIEANAVRLDPNDPAAALVASVMAQDQYESGEALRFARAALDARNRNLDAGLADLPAAQSGRIDIGSAFRNAGLSAQGEHYTSLAASDFNPNSAFGYAQILPDGQARQSSTAVGLMLDPLAVTYPNRFAQFYRKEARRGTVGAQAGVADDGGVLAGVSGSVDGLVRYGGHPYAYAAFLSLDESQPGLDNADTQAALLSLRWGTQRNGRDGIILRATVDARRTELPGSFGLGDPDDRERSVDTVLEAGYTRTNAWNDRWMFRVTGATSDRKFRNPTAFGTNVTGLDYSLAASLGLGVAQDFAARGLFDSTLSLPGEYLLAVEPPAGFPATVQLGGSLLPLADDDDPVFGIKSDSELLSVQMRRLMGWLGAEWSFGLEYGSIDSQSRRDEYAFLIDGVGAVADFGDGSVYVFDAGEPVAFQSVLSSEAWMAQAHANVRFGGRGPWRLEAGVFPTRVETKTTLSGGAGALEDETTSLDPRVAVGWSGDSLRARLAVQRSRLPTGVDTIAPIGVLGITPDRDMGIYSEVADAVSLRIGADLTSRVFFSFDAEMQKLRNASAGLAGERVEIGAFFIPRAELTRVRAGVEAAVSERVSLAASLSKASGEIDGGAFGGNDMPLVPDMQASLTVNWIDPRFFRVGARIGYVGERYADAANLILLDEAVVGGVSLAKETRDKAWLFALDVDAIASDDDAARIGLPAESWRAQARIARRW